MSLAAPRNFPSHRNGSVDSAKTRLSSIQPMAQLHPITGINYAMQRSIFVSQELNQVSHIFFRVDAVHSPLQPWYEGHYALLERRSKDFKV